MDVTITLTLEQALALQGTLCTGIRSLRRDLDYWEKRAGYTELIKDKEEELRDLEATNAILRGAIVRTP